MFACIYKSWRRLDIECKKISLNRETIPGANLHKARITQIQKKCNWSKRHWAHKKAIILAYSTVILSVGKSLGASLAVGFGVPVIPTYPARFYIEPGRN